MNNHFNSFQFAAVLLSLGPLHIVLVDAPSPRGSDADLSIAGTLSERFRQVVAFPL
jgi:hypothetical protein